MPLHTLCQQVRRGLVGRGKFPRGAHRGLLAFDPLPYHGFRTGYAILLDTAEPRPKSLFKVFHGDR